MFKAVQFLMLIGVVVGAPVSQEQVQQVPIPFFAGQNGILALIPVNALQSQNAFSQSQERVMLPTSDSSPFNGGSVFLLNPMNSQNVQPLALGVPQLTRMPANNAKVPVIATTQTVVAAPVASPAPAVAPVAATATTPATSATVQTAAAPSVVATSSVVAATGPKISTVNANADSDYKFTYLVNDPVTGDAKTVSETRQGDRITGSYTVNDPDGVQRTVNYVADPVKGFQATVDLKQTGITPPSAPSSTPRTSAGSSAASVKSSGVPVSGGMNPGASASAQVSMASGSWGWNSNSSNA